MAMDEFPITDLLYERVVVFVVSTTGQGDPPANMAKTWSFLLRRSLPADSLAKMWYCIIYTYAPYNIIRLTLSKIGINKLQGRCAWIGRFVVRQI